METRTTFSTDLIWWELRRLFFNFLMLASGLIVLFAIQIIKPLGSHVAFRYYLELIITLGIFINIAYTAVYIYVFRLTKKVDGLSDKKIAIRDFTFRTVIFVGLLTNLIAGFVELFYRIQFMHLD